MKKQSIRLRNNKSSGSTVDGGISRRTFVKSAATIAAVAATVPLEPMLGGKASVAEAAGANNASTNASANGGTANRMNACFNYRRDMALAQRVNVGPQADNGDAARFTDFSCSYSKALPHDSLGIPNAAAMLSLRRAFATSNAADFANILVGTPGGGPNSRLNGPQGALAFDLEGRDSHATVIPPAPSVASAQTAAEQVEHYWAALLADVMFTRNHQNVAGAIRAFEEAARLMPGNASVQKYLGRAYMRSGNVARGVELPPMHTPERRFLTAAQVAALAEYLDGLLTDLEPAPYGVAVGDQQLVEPIEEQWTVGPIGVAYDDEGDVIVVVLEELVEDEIADEGASVRVRLTRAQVAAFVARGRELVAAGRPACPFCGLPVDPEGHHCPRMN